MNLDNIKRISIRDYLSKAGIKPQSERGNRGMYLSPFRQESNASFSVNYDKNVWFDHGVGAGGSIIDLVLRMENCSVAEAIKQLENDNTLTVLPGSAADTHTQSVIEITSVGSLTHPALLSYTKSRSIDLDVARKYCRQVQYTINGKPYFAIGFKNNAGGWELRNRHFKGSSTPKNITTTRNGNDTIMVFEGFIDFLSYLSLKGNPSPTIDTIVLNSVVNLSKVIPFLQTHSTVHAFLDNDDAGRKALASLRASLPSAEVVDQSAFYRNHKDLNDYIRHKSEPESPARKKKPGLKL